MDSKKKTMDPLQVTMDMNLRKVTRPGCVTYISLGNPRGTCSPWITCGVVDCNEGDRGGGRLSARAAEGITDFEHDSAYIFRIPIAGLKLNSVFDGRVTMTAYIVGNSDELRVPNDPSYDPRKLPGTQPCEYKACGDHHYILPEKYWAGPPEDPRLWKLLVGKKIEIVICPERE